MTTRPATSAPALVKSLFTIGQQMVDCQLNCAGILRNQSQGVYPRCLFLEWPTPLEQDTSSSDPCAHDIAIPIVDVKDLPPAASLEGGAVVIGMNPSHSNGSERTYLKQQHKKHGARYLATVHYWKQHHATKHKYYSRTRELVRAAGLCGPILWTELAKCENRHGVKNPLPRQTYRVCVANFLLSEVSCVPSDWPVFALGKDAYNAACFLLTDRRVVGVPHPTGSYGHFHKLFARSSRKAVQLQTKPRVAVQGVLSSRPPQADWLQA